MRVPVTDYYEEKLREADDAVEMLTVLVRVESRRLQPTSASEQVSAILEWYRKELADHDARLLPTPRERQRIVDAAATSLRRVARQSGE